MIPDRPDLAAIQEELEVAVLFAQEELTRNPPTRGEEIISPLLPNILTIIKVTPSFFLCAQVGSTDEIVIPREGCYRLVVAFTLATNELCSDTIAPSVNMNDILK